MNTASAPWRRRRVSQTDKTCSARTYRNLVDKRLLHLALLLHDLGKGHDEDHSIVGEAIALRTAARLRLGDQDTQTLALLVRRHLDMSLLAFRRDTADPEVIKGFAEWIGTPERLSMLFVLTCADMGGGGSRGAQRLEG